MAMATVSVLVRHPKRGALKDEIVLPGNIQAFIVSPIYARTSGYLKKWYADIGGHAKKGQLLAEIKDRPKWISNWIRQKPSLPPRRRT